MGKTPTTDKAWSKESASAGSASRGLPASIAKRLRWLSHRMQSVGAEMEYYGGFGEIGDHGREMQGAAGIALGWAMGIEASLPNTVITDPHPRKTNYGNSDSD